MATPAEATQDAAVLACTVYSLFNENKFDEAIEYAADDMEIELYGVNLSFRGPEGARQMMGFHKSALPDGRVEVVSQVLSNEGVTNECIYRGTNTAPLQMGPGMEIPPSGNAVEARFCEVWRVRDGKVVSLHNYLDTLGFLAQMGVVKMPGQ